MNCEPCKSLEVTCNHVVNIGYLKELVTIIPNSCCTNITVNGDNDSYCPTYGELMNGSIIPSFSDGGEGAWSNNVDGITISAGYSNNQCVIKKDLKLIYTAFESLTVSNASPVVSECGGVTTTTRELIFRKYTKECDKAVTSETQADTTLSIVWSGTDSENVGTNTYPRNESFTETYPSVVTCSISWRGCEYESSNSVTVSQSTRTFDHNTDYSKSSGTSVDVYCYPRNFDCRGGTSYASATYYYTTWTERHYVDTCGVDYNQENINVENKNSDVSSSLNATSYTFTECTVTTSAESLFNFTATYDGLSDTDFCYMDCPDGCNACPPADYTAYTDIIADCKDGRAIVSGVIHTFSGGHLDGQGNCVGYSENSANTSYSVTWDCTTDGGWIDPHVYVSGAPCCQEYTEYEYGTARIPCESGESVIAITTYTATTHHADGTETTSSGSTSCTINNVSCNDGNERVLSTDCDFDVIQSGGCVCTSCTCSDLVVNSASTISSAGGSNINIGTYDPFICLSGVSAYTAPADTWLTITSVANGVIRATIEPNTDVDNGRSCFVTVSGSTDKGPCYSPLYVEQGHSDCLNPTITTVWNNPDVITVGACETSAEVNLSGTRTTAYTNCQSVSEPIYTSTTVTFDVNTTTTTTQVIRNYNDATITINQQPGLVAVNNGTVPPEGGENLLIGTYNTNTSLINLTAQPADSWVTIVSVSNGEIKANVGVYEDSTQNRNTIITVKGSTNGVECSCPFSLTQTKSGCLNPTVSTVWDSKDITVGACETSAIVELSGTQTTTYDNCSPDVERVTTSTTVTFDANTTSSATSVTKYYNNTAIVINQRPGLVAVSANTITADGGTGLIIGTYNTNTSLINLGASSNETWVTNLSVNNGNIIANVASYDDTEVGRTAIITVTGETNGVSCGDSFMINQEPGSCANPTVTIEWHDTTVNVDACETSAIVDLSGTSTTAYTNCDSESETIYTATTIEFTKNNTAEEKTFYRQYEDATITVTQGEGLGVVGLGPFTSEEHLMVEIGTYNASSNVTNVGASSEDNWVYSFSCYDGSIQAIIKEYTGTTQNRETVITVTGETNGSVCESEFPLVQLKAGCSNPTATTVWNDTGITVGACETSAIVELTGTTTIRYSNCDPDVESASTSTTITFDANITTATTTTTDTYEGARITVTHQPGLVAVNNGNVSSEGGNNLTIGTYNTNTSLINLTASTVASWVTIVSVNNGNIVANVSAYEDSTQDRNATITVKGSTNGVECGDSFTLTQTKSGCLNPTAETTWNSTSVEVAPCVSSATVSISGVETVSYSNCEPVITDITTSLTFTFSENTATTQQTHTETYGDATITIIQGGALNPYSSGDIAATGGSRIEIGRYNTLTNLTNITASQTTLLNPWLSVTNVSNGVIYANVSAYTGNSSRGETIVVSGTYGGVTCRSTFVATQTNSRCACSLATITETELEWVFNDSSSKTTTLTYDSCQSNFTNNASSLAYFNVVATGGRNSISYIITPKEINTSSSSRTETFIITYNADSETCTKEVTLIQNAQGCYCDSETIVSNNASWDQNQSGRWKDVFTFPDCCTYEISVSGDDASWFKYRPSSSSGVTTIGFATTGKNTTNSAKTATTEVVINCGESTCSATAELQQSCVECECFSAITTDTYVIPSSGAASGMLVNTIYIPNTYSSTCLAELKNKETYSDFIDFGYRFATRDATVIPPGEQSPVACKAIDVTTTSNVPQIDREIAKGAYYILYISRSGSGSFVPGTDDVCYQGSIMQEGLVPCDCDSIIGPNGMIQAFETTFDNNGTNGNSVLIASGHTFGCGELIGSIQETDMISPSNFTVVEEKEYADDDEKIIKDVYYYYYAVIEPNTGYTRSAALGFKYKDRHGKLMDCTQTIVIRQGIGLCSCPHVTLSGDITDATGREITEYKYITGVSTYLSDTTNGMCQFVISESDQSWCSAYTRYDGSQLGLYVKARENDTDSARTANITCVNISNPEFATSDIISRNSYYSKAWLESKGITYDQCSSAGVVRFTQPVRVPCTCENCGFEFTNLYGEDYISIDSTSTYRYVNYSLNCGEVTNVTYEEWPYWVRNVTVHDYQKQIYIEVDKNESLSARSFTLKVTVTVENGVTCDYTISVVQSECSCRDALSQIDTFISVNSSAETTGDIFDIACGKELSDYHIVGTNSTGDAPNPIAYLWITAVIREGDYANTGKIVYNISANTSSGERVAYFKLTVDGFEETCSKVIRIKQNPPTNPCESCYTLMKCLDYSDYTFEYDEIYEDVALARLSLPCSCTSVEEIRYHAIYVGDDQDWLTITTTSSSSDFELLGKPNDVNTGSTLRSCYVEVFLTNSNGEIILNDCTRNFMVYQNCELCNCSCNDFSGDRNYLHITASQSADGIEISRDNDVSNPLNVGYIEIPGTSLTDCLTYTVSNTQSSVLETSIVEDKSYSGGRKFIITAYLNNPGTTAISATSNIIRINVISGSECSGSAMLLTYSIPTIE